MNRRDFIVLFSIGWFVNCLPVVFAMTYATQPKPIKPKSSTSENWFLVGTVAELDKTGQIFKEKSPFGPILVIGTSKSQNLIAVNPTCTHLNCKVEWEVKEKIFLCPCHASEFGVDGKVQNGPATKPLSTYLTKIEDNSVMVRRI
ncbi:ubiquinol-cytochrome c reductase iron-sulfur subunit [Iningainema tapete]|uniref:Ubiquinol-cytochrome c reductase iron-sulfur subunit n=1 Tax=Iningainema tapete BLCC-T55 TaxID=2748662 RepID=A0A8J6XIR8_9CYAN|nr:ubiquinol-cytochrome c reductase iron-sulfur subunit [Iningainema tapete]MBD2772174.1 ubiquinol-cytochrome c reductase iron-sulfur subunit [Iningainema tapete BLCC-T55]